MGRTLETFTRLVDREKGRLKKFRRALRREDQEVLDELFAAARYHAAAGAYAGDSVPLEIMLLSMLIEQRKEINRLREHLGETEVSLGPPDEGEGKEEGGTEDE